MRTRKTFGLLAFPFLAGVTVFAQAPAGETKPSASFRTGVNLVLVPVTVRDRDGNAIGDLAQESFQVFDKGKPRRIVSFSVENQAQRSAAMPERFLAYFLDDVSIGNFAEATRLRDATLHSIDNLRSGDRMAIFSSSCRLAQDFTDDRAKLREVASRLQGAPIGICRVSHTLQIILLKAVVRRMAHLPGQRTIVAISAGFPVAREREVLREELVDLAIRSQVTIHAVHVSDAGDTNRSLDVMHGRKDETAEDRISARPDPANLIMIAEGAGGEVIEGGNLLDVALRRVATPSYFYILGFEPGGGTPDETYHKLKVTLKDARKLNVKARAGYFAGRTPVESATVAPAPPVQTAAPVPGPPVPSTGPIVDEIRATAATPEVATADQPAMFRTRSNLVLVPVIVRDRQGNAIGDLRESDFQLADQGKRQEITMFNLEKSGGRAAQPAPEVVKPAAPGEKATLPPPVIPDRFIAYVFDDVHIRIGDLAQVREAVWKNITESLGPADRIAVVTTSGRVRLDFTGDREKLRATMYRIQPTPVYRSMCYKCGDLSFMQGYKVLTGDAVAMKSAMAIVGSPMDQGSPTSSPNQPNTPGSLAQPRNPASDTPLQMRAETAAHRAVQGGELETELSLHTLRDMARRMSGLAGHRVMILLSHGFFATDALQGEVAETIDRAIRSGVVIHTLNSSGLRTGMEMGQSGYDDDTVGPSSGNDNASSYSHQAQLAGAETMRGIADGTGGTAIESSNDYLSAVRRLATPPEYLYTLGFSPQDLAADGRFHRLTIKLANGERYTVQARRGYYAPKRADELTEAAAKEIENAIFNRDEVRDLPVDLKVEVSKADGGSSEVVVVTAIDVKLLHLRKANDRNCDDLTVVAALFDHDGNFIAGKQKVLRLRLRDETVASLEQRPPATLKTAFALGSGDYLVRLVVRSAQGQSIASASSAVVVP